MKLKVAQKSCTEPFESSENDLKIKNVIESFENALKIQNVNVHKNIAKVKETN